MHSKILSTSLPGVSQARSSSEEELRRKNLQTHHHRHDHHLLTRRHFLQMSAALAGSAAGINLLRRTALAAKPGTGIPKQLPDFSQPLKDTFGLEIPFFLPIQVDPFNADPDAVATPITIWDFSGTMGLIEAEGVSDAEHNSDGVPRSWSCDVRFMDGVFVDQVGRTQRGAFTFL